jgi:hypothetical protein
MAAKRFQVAIAADTAFPRDRFVNTLYFEDIGTSDQDGLCNDLAHIFDSFWYSEGTREIWVKSYEVGPPPNFPIGEAKLNAGLNPPSSVPREVALCLSFHGGNNLPRQRGRIYLSAAGAVTAVSTRPANSLMQKAVDLGQHFADLGGADVSWNVHSQTTGEDIEVTTCFADDEWDTVRSRGLDPSYRITGTPGS